jgi:hypothetical protein
MTSVNPGPAHDSSVRPAVSAEVAEEHAFDRWNRQMVAAEQQSAASRLRVKIIAGVVVAGVVTWLALTL